MLSEAICALLTRHNLLFDSHEPGLIDLDMTSAR